MAGQIEPFEVFALSYARHAGRMQGDNILHGDIHEAGDDLEYYVWVARRSDRLFVIDTGFGEAAAAARGRQLLQRPAQRLALMGIDAASVDDVIITHLHYDHAGTLSDFPQARLHVQDAEMAYATGRCMCHLELQRPYDVEDVVGLVRRVYGGKVCFHHDRQDLCDGLSLHRIGGHSAGLQVVRVWTRRGWVVLASDASHFYAHMQQAKVFPIVHNIGEVLEGYRTLHHLAASPEHIIPGHDRLVLARYPAPRSDLEGIVARLDVAPRNVV